MSQWVSLPRSPVPVRFLFNRWHTGEMWVFLVTFVDCHTFPFVSILGPVPRKQCKQKNSVHYCLPWAAISKMLPLLRKYELEFKHWSSKKQARERNKTFRLNKWTWGKWSRERGKSLFSKVWDIGRWGKGSKGVHGKLTRCARRDGFWISNFRKNIQLADAHSPGRQRWDYKPRSILNTTHWQNSEGKSDSMPNVQNTRKEYFWGYEGIWMNQKRNVVCSFLWQTGRSR